MNATMTRNQLAEKKPDGKEEDGTHTTVRLAETEAGQKACGPMKKGKVLHRSRTDGRWATKQGC